MSEDAEFFEWTTQIDFKQLLETPFDDWSLLKTTNIEWR